MLRARACEHKKCCEGEDEHARTESQRVRSSAAGRPVEEGPEDDEYPDGSIQKGRKPEPHPAAGPWTGRRLLPPPVQNHRGDHHLSCPYRASKWMVARGINEAEQEEDGCNPVGPWMLQVLPPDLYGVLQPRARFMRELSAGARLFGSLNERLRPPVQLGDPAPGLERRRDLVGEDRSLARPLHGTSKRSQGSPELRHVTSLSGCDKAATHSVVMSSGKVGASLGGLSLEARPFRAS